MTEREGCDVLRRRFEGRGFQIEERHRLVLDAGELELDGFDPVAKVGYEYLTSEAGDREEITPAMVFELEERMTKGELRVLLLDEAEHVTEADLVFAADRFLERLAQP
jgi:hypothetical protein